MDGISALMDGELDEHPARTVFAALKDDPELRDRWATYHLISDALKGEPLLSPAFSAGFSASLAERLAAEPTVLAPKRSALTPKRASMYALSAAASISAAAFVAWVAMSGTGPEAAPAFAVNDAKPAAAPIALPVSAVSDSSMNQYFLLHQGVSPSTEFQGVAPYIRSVSAIRPADQAAAAR